MTTFVTSADGARIGFDELGQGDPIIVIGGLLCDRRRLAGLAHELARDFLVVNYDRRGRGDSTTVEPCAVDREIEDLAALLDALGRPTAVYGHSSGAALALRAAAAELPITRLVVHEPPYGPDDPESRQSALALATEVREAIRDDRPGDAVAAFFGAMGLPDTEIEQLCHDPELLRMAPTMVYDHEVMGDFDHGGTIPVDLVARIRIPTLVLAGDASPDFFHQTAERLAALLPAGRLGILAGADHGAPADVVAPAVAAFLGGRDADLGGADRADRSA